MDVYRDPLWERGPGGVLRLNETEAELRADTMARRAEVAFRRSAMAAARGLPTSEVSAASASRAEREEREREARVEEGLAEGDEDDEAAAAGGGGGGGGDGGGGVLVKLPGQRGLSGHPLQADPMDSDPAAGSSQPSYGS